MLLALVLQACGDGSTTPEEHATPVVTGITPTSVVAGSASFELTVTGTGFVEASAVHWNGAPRPTTLVSANELRASIPAADVSASGTFAVTVVTPAPGGGESQTWALEVTPAPVASVTVSPDALSLVPGQQDQLVATLRAGDGSELADREVEWTSDSPDVATVDGEGVVTGVAAGSASITASSEGESESAQVTVLMGGLVGSEGGLVEDEQGQVEIDVPAGALTTDVPISVVGEPSPPAHERLLPGTAWRLGPDGTAFEEPVTISLTYDPDSMLPDGDPERLAVARWTGEAWVPLAEGEVDAAASVVSGSTTSFSVFAVIEVIPPDFDIAVSPAQATLHGELGAVMELVIERVGGFEGEVGLSFEGLPPGVTGTFHPAVTDGDHAVLSLIADAGTAPGESTLTLVAMADGGVVRSADVELTIRPTPAVTHGARTSAAAGPSPRASEYMPNGPAASSTTSFDGTFTWGGTETVQDGAFSGDASADLQSGELLSHVTIENRSPVSGPVLPLGDRAHQGDAESRIGNTFSIVRVDPSVGFEDVTVTLVLEYDGTFQVPAGVDFESTYESGGLLRAHNFFEFWTTLSTREVGAFTLRDEIQDLDRDDFPDFESWLEARSELEEQHQATFIASTEIHQHSNAAVAAFLEELLSQPIGAATPGDVSGELRLELPLSAARTVFEWEATLFARATLDSSVLDASLEAALGSTVQLSVTLPDGFVLVLDGGFDEP